MAFIDDFKRNAAYAADKAVKKTNDMTSIAKLNLNIRTCNAKLEAVYSEIGRLFYTAERSNSDFTSDIAANIMKADKINADILSYKKKLSSIRNVTVCEGCGKEISKTSAFCSFCGMKQVHPEPEKNTTDSPDDAESPLENDSDKDTSECSCDDTEN